MVYCVPSAHLRVGENASNPVRVDDFALGGGKYFTGGFGVRGNQACWGREQEGVVELRSKVNLHFGGIIIVGGVKGQAEEIVVVECILSCSSDDRPASSSPPKAFQSSKSSISNIATCSG